MPKDKEMGVVSIGYCPCLETIDIDEHSSELLSNSRSTR